MSREKRIEYIDIARGILIFLVIIGHVVIYENSDYNIRLYTYISKFIYTFHMPAFFLISGMIYKKERWQNTTFGKFLKRKIFTLIIPYVFFECIAIIYKAIVLKQAVVNGIYNMFTLKCNVGADWFLPAFFISNCLFFLFYKASRKWSVYSILVIGCFCLPIILPATHYFHILSRGLLGYGFMLCGYILKKFYLSDKQIRWNLNLVIAFFVVAICAKLNSGDMYEVVIGNPLLYVLGGCSGTYLILGIAKQVHNKLMQFLGENSLIVMGTHQLVIYTVSAYIGVNSNYLFSLFLIAIIVVIELPLIWLLNRFFPMCIGKCSLKSAETNI